MASNPFQALIRSRKFWLAVLALTQSLIFQFVPNFPDEVGHGCHQSCFRFIQQAKEIRVGVELPDVLRCSEGSLPWEMADLQVVETPAPGYFLLPETYIGCTVPGIVQPAARFSGQQFREIQERSVVRLGSVVVYQGQVSSFPQGRRSPPHPG